jgi:tRNA U34 5-carboxymethylaminomethyl modifying GTPase MnmE/TrmE
VVAADDGVKPQTAEAIRFARSANAKIVVAINKIDKEAANPQLVRTQLATEYDLNPEEWGGSVVMVEVSAKTGQGIDKLLDMVLLVSDIEELKADIDTPAEGLVIEAHMEQGDWIRFVRSAGELADAPIHVYDKSATFARIRSESRRWRAAHTDAGKDALIVIDYLGLIASDAKKGKNEIREQEVAGWTRGLKALGKELRAVIVLLAQLNRAVESRADKRPMMSDLRDSGAIEQDADAIVMVYQDEKYNPDSPYKGIAEAIIAKARMGETGRVYLQFDGERSRFRNADMRELASIHHEQEQAASAKSNRRYASL